MLVEMTPSDLDLLQQFTRDHAQDAFTELVRRHVNLVHSAALRQVRSPQLAEEVAQSVFADLAREAGKLKPDTILTAWLHAVTRRTAIDVIRKESRRQLREQIAHEMNATNAPDANWNQIEPLLDEAVAALDDTDRAAVLLRFFENKSLLEVGQQLGVSDDTAQKRVSRAVEKLREFFAKRGVTVGAGGLVVVISANAVQAAPVGLIATISATVFAGTAVTTSTVIAATKTIAMTTLQKIAVTAALTATIGVGVFQAKQAHDAAAEVQKLQAQQTSLTEQIQTQQTEREKSSATIASLKDDLTKNEKNQRELLKLRGQVGQLQSQLAILKQSSEAALAQADDANDTSPDTLFGRYNLLKAQLKKHPEWSIPEIQFLIERDWMTFLQGWHMSLADEGGIRMSLSRIRSLAKDKFVRRLWEAMRGFARDNDGSLPSSLALLKPYLDKQTMPPEPGRIIFHSPGTPLPKSWFGLQNYPPVDDALLQRYQMIVSGNINSLRTNQYVLIEKSPVDDRYDTLLKVGLNNSVSFGVGQDTSLGYSGTPDLSDMTPEQLDRYNKHVATTAKSNQSEFQQINNRFDEQWQKLNAQHSAELSTYSKKQSDAARTHVADETEVKASVTQADASLSDDTKRNMCMDNLRHIDAAIQIYAFEHGWTSNSIVDVKLISPLLASGQIPHCPAGGTYHFGRVDRPPTCSIPGHEITK